MAQQKPFRILNRDGTFNIVNLNPKRSLAEDLYHQLISKKWSHFLALIICGFFLTNSFFGLLYYFVGADSFAGMQTGPDMQRLLDCFFFSVQTLATIGYGRISPVGLLANLLVTFEALTGLLGIAVATGILFARFSKPISRIIFSEKAVITQQDGTPTLMIRVANQRLNQIVEAKVVVSLIKNEITKEGDRYRNFYALKLERDQSPLFTMSWTIAHEIDSQSPLFNMNSRSLEESEAELIVTFTGVDDTINQMLHSRTSYTPQEIVWDARFKDMMARTSDGKVGIQLKDLSEIEKYGSPHIT